MDLRTSVRTAVERYEQRKDAAEAAKKSAKSAYLRYLDALERYAGQLMLWEE